MGENVKIDAWTDQCPAKADAGDAYYFVRRKDKLDVVVMGFSMGKAWLNGVSYEPSEIRSHLFLGPLTPTEFAQTATLKSALSGYLNEHAMDRKSGKCFCLLCESARAALSGKEGE